MRATRWVKNLASSAAHLKGWALLTGDKQASCWRRLLLAAAADARCNCLPRRQCARAAPPRTLARAQGKNATGPQASTTAQRIIQLQHELPRARVLYSSATGAPLNEKLAAACRVAGACPAGCCGAGCRCLP